MDYFHRWNLRILAALIIMLPILILLELLNCIPESPGPAQEPNPKIPKSFDHQVPSRGAPTMKVENPLMSRFASGTLGHQLIYRGTPQGTAAYLHFNPKQPHTEAQVNHHILFSLLAKRWYRLDPPAKQFWIPFAQELKITPYNAYLGYNLHRLNPAQPEGLIGWWPNLVPAGQILHDLSANRKDAEFVSLDPDLAWPDDPVRRGQVIEYDGTGYVNVPTPLSSVTEYTWAFWFKQNAYSEGAACVDTGVTAHYAQAQTMGGRIRHRLRAAIARTATGWDLELGWHHYAGTYTPNNIEIYIDGLFNELVPAPDAPAANVYMHFGIHDIGVPPVGFSGRVDDLRFYARFLTGPEIAELAAR